MVISRQKNDGGHSLQEEEIACTCTQRAGKTGHRQEPRVAWGGGGVDNADQIGKANKSHTEKCLDFTQKNYNFALKSRVPFKDFKEDNGIIKGFFPFVSVILCLKSPLMTCELDEDYTGGR